MSEPLGPRQIALIAILAATIPGALPRASSTAAQIIATNGAPQGPRTGMIVGQVLDGTTGAPVPEAIVRLSMPAFQETLPTTPKGRVMADGNGRFFFSELPSGEYWLQATIEGYIGGSFGQRRAGGQSALLTLREGERRIDATLRVWKYAVIGGTVVDEAGEPVVGVAVRALVKDVVAGRTQFGKESYLVPSALTDDRGMFRLARVEPGTYAIVAPSMHTTVPVSIMNSQDATTFRNDLFFGGIYEVSQLGQPRTQQVGDLALMTLNSVLIPPQASAAGRMSVYRTTYFPSATKAGDATLVTIGAGEERTDLAMTLRPVPAMRVSGRLVTPDGSAPPPTVIRLVGEAKSDVITQSTPSGIAEVGFETATAMSDAAGRFTLLAVPPGEYLLIHADPFLVRFAREGRQAYWASQRITVGAEDLTDLVVDVRPALRVEGRIAFLGPNGPQPSPPTALPFGGTVFGVSLEAPSGGTGYYASATKDIPVTFSTLAAGGRFIVRPHESSGWFVHSVTLAGKDITDRAIDLQTDATSLVVTYTDRPSKLSGAVKDAAGSANPNAIVLAFPIDPQQWVDYGREPRSIKRVLVSTSGTYTIDHLPPGSYYVVAIDRDLGDGWNDPKTLQTLSSRAEKLTVGAGDTARTLDLTVRAVR